MKNIDEVREYLKRNNAEYILRFYDELNETERENLLKQIDKIDFDMMKMLYENREVVTANLKAIDKMPYIIASDIPSDDKNKYTKIGEELIKNGKVAVCQMAGGQGTRLGHVGPKGTFMVPINPPKSIFEIFSDKLKETYNKYGVKVRWYLMTSNDNDADTKAFFEKNNYFNYGKENITFFKQAELPLLDMEGNVVMSDKSKVFMAPNGNGGIFQALHTEKVLEELKDRKIEYLGIGNVDNILLDILDPTFIGAMNCGECDLAIKTVTKNSPTEKVGVVCKIDGKPGVIEYTEVSSEMANSRDENGNFEYGEAYYGLAMFKTELLEKIVQGLSYHVAFKKNSYLDKDGKVLTSETPNTYKFEMFIFEGFNMSEKALVYSVKREENFAPIKNKEGTDSPETATKLYNDFYGKQ